MLSAKKVVYKIMKNTCTVCTGRSTRSHINDKVSELTGKKSPDSTNEAYSTSHCI
jgi:hypothetical protein